MISAGVVLAGEESEPGSGMGSLIFLVLIGGAVYLILFGPQRRRMKSMRAKVKQVRDSVEYGDEIVTVGGIYGRVTSVTEHDVTIDVGGGTKLRVTRRAIAERIGEDTE